MHHEQISNSHSIQSASLEGDEMNDEESVVRGKEQRQQQEIEDKADIVAEYATGNVDTIGNDEGDTSNAAFYQDDPSNVDRHAIMSSKCMKMLKIVLCTNVVSDNLIYIGRFKVIESIGTVRILKFIGITILLILVNHSLVRGVDWEHDAYYSLYDFFYYDLSPVVLYSVFFAVVGRIWDRRGVDRLQFILPTFLSAFLTSAFTNVWFLRNSVTFYAISCGWPWQLFVFTAFVALIIITVVFLHIRSAIRDSSFVQRIVEIFFLIALFFLPPFFHPHFHLHHYYSSWLLGMIFNRDEWWSQLTMAIMWGQFINGISVYGKDSTYTCAHALHSSISNRCLFINETGEGVDITGAIQEYGAQWMETLLGSGDVEACFAKAAAAPPNYKDCTR